jgi:hypothetical protein
LQTKQIRTEKPGEGDGNAVFKFIPIDEVTVAPQNTNVLKLASTKSPFTTTSGKVEVQTMTAKTATDINMETPQIQSRLKDNDDTSSTTPSVTSANTITETATVPMAIASMTPSPITIIQLQSTITLPVSEGSTTTSTLPPTTTFAQTTTTSTTTTSTTTVVPIKSTTQTTSQATTSEQTIIPTTNSPSTVTSIPTVTAEEERQYQQDAKILQELLKESLDRDPKNLNIPPSVIANTFTNTVQTTTTSGVDDAKFLQMLLGATGQNVNTLTFPSINTRLKDTNEVQTTTARSIEDDIRQFEEDTKLLKALLQATGQNPDNFNLPTLNFGFTTQVTTQTTTEVPTSTTTSTTTERPTSTTTSTTTTTQRPTPTTTISSTTTAQNVDDEIKRLQDDTKLLQALLQATGKNTDNFNIPIISGITSNVRIASNPQTTTIESSPTTPVNIRPVYTKATTPPAPDFTFTPRNTEQTSTTTDDVGISTTFFPFNQGSRLPLTTERAIFSTTSLTGRRAPSSVTVSTEIPSTSTFSVDEDLTFLKNLVS